MPSLYKSVAAIAAWSAAFGLLQAILHMFVLAVFGLSDVAPHTLLMVVAGIPGQCVTGLVLALPLWAIKNRLLKAAAFLPTVAITVFNMFAFHYEAVFGFLPGGSVLYYLGEIKTIKTSLVSQAPAAWILGELLAASAVMAALTWQLQGPLENKLRAGRRAFRASTVLFCAALAFTLTAHIFPALLKEPCSSHSRIPLAGFLQSLGKKNSAVVEKSIDPEDIRYFQKRLGHREAFGGADPAYPLCGAGPRGPGRGGNDRSVVFLILEGLGAEEVFLDVDGKPLTPNLRAMAADELWFSNIYASGTQSCQCLPALFSGLPGQTSILLWEKPLPRFDGFPRILKQKGYSTAYFHGGDLSFEQQRAFLRMAGFEKIYEFDEKLGKPVYGWGYSDREMFAWLRTWIELHRSQHAEEPFLASLYTLTSHYPFELPADHVRVIAEDVKLADFYETLRFLDDQLGEFYAWFKEHEAPRGTRLVITSDHAPLPVNREALKTGGLLRFDVPLVIGGLDDEERASWQALAHRYGGHHDMPATILDLLDLSPGPCDQGISLLAPGETWPDERFVYGVGGKELSQIYLWTAEIEILADAVLDDILVLSEPETGPKGKSLLKEASRFINLIRPLNDYLAEKNAFFPPVESTQ